MPLSDAILDGLTGIVGPGQVLTSRKTSSRTASTGRRRFKQRPEAVVFPRSTADVVALRPARGERVGADRHARIGHGTERRQRAECGRDGAVPRADERDPRRRSAEPHAARAAGRHDDHDRRGGRTTRAVLSAGSRVDAHQHDRRQRRGELRRAARPEVRRHARLRDGARSRAGRRPNRAVRQPVREGRRRLLDEGPVHRIGRARSASSPRSC